jgi:hypothetical protein
MSKIFTNQISTPSGTSFNLPKSDGTANQIMATDGAGNLQFVTQPSYAIIQDTVLPADNTNVWGSVITDSARYNAYEYAWSSSGPWTTYYNSRATGSNTNSTTQAWNMFLGDGFPSTEDYHFYANNMDGMQSRRILYANNYRVGFHREMYYAYNYTGDYAGCTWQVIPIRNPTGSTISSTIYWTFSAYNSTYGGASVGTFTPNASTYSGTNSGTWNQLYGYEGQTQTTTNQTISVPAYTTILLMGCSGHYYNTTYQFADWNLFWNLNTLTGAGLVCDLRMLKALEMGRSQSNGYTSSYPHQIYNSAAAMFGDR